MAQKNRATGPIKRLENVVYRFERFPRGNGIGKLAFNVWLKSKFRAFCGTAPQETAGLIFAGQEIVKLVQPAPGALRANLLARFSYSDG